MWCPDVKNKVTHPSHWHVVKADNIVIAQGECSGFRDDFPVEAGSLSERVASLEATVDDLIEVCYALANAQKNTNGSVAGLFRLVTGEEV